MIRKVFISHSSKDSRLVREFIEKLLILGLNFKREQVFCTSLEGANIRSGSDFKESIKVAIEEADIGFLIVTANYKESEVCLNEMGALWMVCQNVIPLILEPVSYSNVGFIHSTSQILKINSKQDLLRLADDHNSLLKESVNLSNYNSQIDSFISGLNVPKKEQKTSLKKSLPTEEDFEVYFSRFFEPDINTTNLILRAQPTLDDCIKVFTEKYARTLFGYYGQVFTQALDHTSQDEMASLVSYSYECTDYNQIKSGDHNFPGGMTSLYEKGALKPGNNYYIISFKNQDNSDGFSMKIWCFLNGRWVWFPGILSITNQVDEVIEDQDVHSIIKYASKLGIGKEFSDSSFAVMATSYIITEVIRKNKSI